MNESARQLTTVTSGIATLVSIAGGIAILVVISTVVRRHRPDAYRPLLAWSIASLASGGFSIIVYPALGLLVRGSTDSYLTALALVRLLTTGVHVVLVLLLIRGLVAIAQPPKPFVVPSDAPYR